MAENSKKQHEVRIYSLPTCIHCNHAKEFFKKHNVKYKDINVQNDRKAAKEMVEKTGQHGVPVILIDGKWGDAIIGFDGPALKRRLGIR